MMCHLRQTVLATALSVSAMAYAEEAAPPFGSEDTPGVDLYVRKGEAILYNRRLGCKAGRFAQFTDLDRNG